MNMMMKEHTLHFVSGINWMRGGFNVQAYDAKGRNKAGVEDVGDSERKAEDYA
jgi:hypothetical protein